MKKFRIIFLLFSLLALTVWIFWDPILDFLPIDQSGWIEQNGDLYLLDEDGDPRTGWYTSPDGTYYFREDGVMHTGWLELDGKRYLLNENGSPVSGWQTMDENICYVTEDGTIPTGWLELDGQRYYLTDQGFRHTGWLNIGDDRYYFDSQGILFTGWLELEEDAYYMNENGAMTVGWAELQDGTYYFDESGRRCCGWLELDEKRYYLDEVGRLYTGWLELDGKKYYLLPDGASAVGMQEIDGQRYFFSSKGVNFILVNPWNYLPEDFTVELVELSGVYLDPVCQDALTQMLDDCRAAGYHPQVVSSYRSIAYQQANLQRMIQSYQDMGYSYARAYSAATKIVAVPGTSEHHLGLAFDIVDASYLKLDHQQAQTPAQQWLMEHCWEYGFILRYPKDSTDITGIIWEPWHYRYVGTEISLEVRDLGCITLEEYINALTDDGNSNS